MINRMPIMIILEHQKKEIINFHHNYKDLIQQLNLNKNIKLTLCLK